MGPFVIELTEQELSLARDFYQDYLIEQANKYVLFFAKLERLTVTAYTTGKMVISGENSDEEYKMWLIKLNKEAQFDKLNIIGTDEVGTGDFFGPVVVVATYVDKEHIPFLMSLGVTDSKLLSDKKIVRLALRIKTLIPYSLLVLDNEKYNQLTKKGYNLNHIKAILHNHAITRLKGKIKLTPDRIVIDQFCSPSNYFQYIRNEKRINKEVAFQTKAESKYLSVACSSILARYIFLQKLEEMGREIGIKLQKGASKLVDEQIKQIIALKGEKYLEQIGKLNFKNMEKVKAL